MSEVKYHWITLALLTACVSALPQGGVSQQPRPGGGAPHSIRGKLFLPTGTPPEIRIRVLLEVSTGGIAGETFSDSVGNFEFRSLTSGNYILKVIGDGRQYETTQENIELSGAIGRTHVSQLYLREKSRDARDKPDKLLLSVADIQEVPKAARKPYEKGLKLAQANQPQEAIAQFEEAVKLFPDYLHALNKLGEQLAQRGDLPAAQAAYERALKINQRFALPHIGLGILFNNQKKFAEAIEHLEAANQMDDSFPLAHLNLGLALMERQPTDYARAEKELNRALALGGKGMAYTYMILFNLYIRQRQYAQAVAQLESYLKELPNAPDAPQIKQRIEAIKKMLAQQSSAHP